MAKLYKAYVDSANWQSLFESYVIGNIDIVFNYNKELYVSIYNEADTSKKLEKSNSYKGVIRVIFRAKKIIDGRG